MEAGAAAVHWASSSYQLSSHFLFILFENISQLCSLCHKLDDSPALTMQRCHLISHSNCTANVPLLVHHSQIYNVMKTFLWSSLSVVKPPQVPPLQRTSPTTDTPGTSQWGNTLAIISVLKMGIPLLVRKMASLCTETAP